MQGNRRGRTHPWRNRAHPWRGRTLAIGVAAVLLAGACGGDDDSGGSTSSTIPDEPAGGVTPADLTTWCAAMQEVDLRIAALSSGAGDPAATGAAIDTAEDAAPPEIAAAVDELASYNRKIVADAEAAGSETPASAPAIPPDSYFTAAAEAGTFMAANCDFGAVEVTATEYSFSGLDGDIAPGTTLLQFTNDGDEYHEVDIEKLADGEERSATELQDLMQTAPDQAAALLTPVASDVRAAEVCDVRDLRSGARPVPGHVPRARRCDAGGVAERYAARRERLAPLARHDHRIHRRVAGSE